MSWLARLAHAARLPDRITRWAVRRRVLHAPDRASRVSARAGDERFGRALAAPRLPAPWCPADIPTELDCVADTVLGERRLRASAHWPAWAKDLDGAEREMLSLIAKRAQIGTDDSVLWLGRGRGALFLREELGVRSAIESPERVLASTGTDDPRRAAPERDSFERVVVVEAFPAENDPRAFLGGLAERLRPGGRLFVQLACHRRFTHRLTADEAVWLGLRVGSLIPATDLLPRLCPELRLVGHWELSGEHYERTARAWRRRLEATRSELADRLAADLERGMAEHLLDEWRSHLVAREEMFGLRGGQEWWISQYALERSEL